MGQHRLCTPNPNHPATITLHQLHNYPGSLWNEISSNFFNYTRHRKLPSTRYSHHFPVPPITTAAYLGLFWRAACALLGGRFGADPSSHTTAHHVLLLMLLVLLELLQLLLLLQQPIQTIINQSSYRNPTVPLPNLKKTEFVCSTLQRAHDSLTRDHYNYSPTCSQC